MRHRLGSRLPPAELPALAVEAQDLEAIEVGWWSGLRLELWVQLRQLVRLGLAVGLRRGDDKHLIIPDNRRGAAETRQLGLPVDVDRRVPPNRRIGAGRGDAIGG